MWFSIQHGVTACNGGLSARCVAGVRGGLFAAFYCTVLGSSIAASLSRRSCCYLNFFGGLACRGVLGAVSLTTVVGNTRLTDQLIGKADQAHGAEIPGCIGVADGRIDCGDYEERHTEKEELGVARSRRATGVLFFFPIVGRSLQAGQAARRVSTGARGPAHEARRAGSWRRT